MIWIDKGKEPGSWARHKLTPGAKYERTEDLGKSLLKDQGYLCAYCMRRIPVSDCGALETSHIEHIVPQSRLTDKEAMDYGNMLICCPGAISGTIRKSTHCDRHKSETVIHFSPLDKNFISTIKYRSDGTIESSDATCNKELNEILNLNIPLLKANRKQIKDSIIRQLMTKRNREWKKSDIQKLIDFYSTKNARGEYPEYCGVARWYLSRKL